jgi:hypothetical protein
MFGKERNCLILLCFPVTNAPGCTGINAKTLGLKDLRLSYMNARDVPPDRGTLVHYWKDKLLIQQNSVSVGETTAV